VLCRVMKGAGVVSQSGAREKPGAVSVEALDELPCALVLTALPVERAAVRAHLRDVQEAVHPKGTVYEQGVFDASPHSWKVGLVEVGAGNQEAAFEAERAINYFKPSVVFFVGVAGGLKDVRLGDVVAATKVYGYERGAAREEFQPRPDVGESSYSLVQRARAEASWPNWQRQLRSDAPAGSPRVFVAPIAAGEKVVKSESAPVAQFLRDQYSDALAVEMEGRGFLKAAQANEEVRALVVRGISDLLSGKEEADAAGGQEVAAPHASAFAFEVLAKLTPPAPRVSASKQPNRARPLWLLSILALVIAGSLVRTAFSLLWRPERDCAFSIASIDSKPVGPGLQPTVSSICIVSGNAEDVPNQTVTIWVAEGPQLTAPRQSVGSALVKGEKWTTDGSVDLRPGKRATQDVWVSATVEGCSAPAPAVQVRLPVPATSGRN
jgi:nucleoside phosphorylase